MSLAKKANWLLSDLELLILPLNWLGPICNYVQLRNTIFTPYQCPENQCALYTLSGVVLEG